MLKIQRINDYLCSMNKYHALLIAALASLTMNAQTKIDGKVEFDHTVHDFGDVYVSKGPVNCTFRLKNISDSPVIIYSVTTSCGCTDVKWTRDEIAAGKEGIISATYSNDEGPYPFDKTLTAYISECKKPVVLHMRGVAREKEKPLAESYPVHLGALALKSADIKGGNMSQGEQKSGQVMVANVSGKAVRITFSDVSDGLNISVSPSTIPANSTATISYVVSSDRKHWGKNYYYATPLIDGKSHKASGRPAAKQSVLGGEALRSSENTELGSGSAKIGIWTFTKENFSDWTKEEKKMGASPVFESTNCHIGRVKAGKTCKASFTYTNKGKSDFVIYKADSEHNCVEVKKMEGAAPGKEGKLEFIVNSAELEKGEATLIVNLTTNSPIRPLVSLYITGIIE